MVKEINNLDDVRLFAEGLVQEGTNFHPDDNFHAYVNIKTGLNTYTKSEATLRNQLMQKSFKICRENEIDIYDFMTELVLMKSGLNKFIPLPSEEYKA
jgi:hypothetical protein